MRKLPITTVTARGEARDIAFPLHEQTRDEALLEDLVPALLQTITERLAAHHPASDGDVLQALAMVAAIRTDMVDAPAHQAAGAFRRFYETALQAVDAAPSTMAGRG